MMVKFQSPDYLRQLKGLSDLISVLRSKSLVVDIQLRHLGLCMQTAYFLLPDLGS